MIKAVTGIETVERTVEFFYLYDRFWVNSNYVGVQVRLDGETVYISHGKGGEHKAADIPFEEFAELVSKMIDSREGKQ